jgi:hypothetical protein
MANGLLLVAVLALVAAMIVVLRQYLLLARKNTALQNQLGQMRGGQFRSTIRSSGC